MKESSKTIIQKALHRYYNGLNEMQREAVFQIDGPVLILAGAGSGKTTVLINRIEYMVLFGNSYNSAAPALTADQLQAVETYIDGETEDIKPLIPLLQHRPIRPWNVLAITFTNKAAEELRNRLSATLGEETASDIQASTFHSLCMRILRRNIPLLGYDSSFTIYDTDDSLRVIKAGLEANSMSDKMVRPRGVLSAISRAKDNMTGPKQLLKETISDYREHQIAKVYDYYQTTLKNANALDFDDIIVLTVELFQKHPEVLEYYQNRYKYIMVDEYQDTNQTQYLLVSLLAGGHHNLCVVGDDDQSIYKFRGATIENILSFEDQFPGAKVIRLEQNYRSTQNILSSANQLISNNTARKGKNLWTESGDGEQLNIVNLEDETLEARYIADSIMEGVEQGGKWRDNAVLYRMNAQSGAIERALAQRAVPYRIIGGLRFYERKEIKDIVSYLSVLNNTADDLRLSRIVNEPKRGIGATTIGSATEISSTLNLSLYEVLKTSDQYAPLSRRSAALIEFTDMIEALTQQVETLPLDEFFDVLLEKTGYMQMLKAQGKESEGRIENVLELKTNIMQYMETAPEPSLSGFLEEIALYTDLDNYDGDANTVVLMTVHSAKGLEFPNVYLAGLEENIFPGWNSQNDPAEIEEERRLAYVAITRAKKEVTITYTDRRMLFGKTNYSRPSRFISELPEDTIQLHSSSLSSPLNESVGAGYKGRGGKRASGTSVGVGGASQSQTIVSLTAGDRVAHNVFGEGTVLSSKPMGGDQLLEIDFDTAGQKKIMATFARLKNCSRV